MARLMQLAIAAGLAAGLSTGAIAQQTPAQPDIRDEIRTGTRLPMIEVIGAIRDQRAPKRAEAPADRRLPELPVVYEDAPTT
jgi:hypothetical protein